MYFKYIYTDTGIWNYIVQNHKKNNRNTYSEQLLLKRSSLYETSKQKNFTRK